jgi:hypothetical protein
MAAAAPVESASMATAAANGSERRHGTEGCHRKHKGNRSEGLPNHLHESAFHNHLQTTPF